jgi:hypothetical protein
MDSDYDGIISSWDLQLQKMGFPPHTYDGRAKS